LRSLNTSHEQRIIWRGLRGFLCVAFAALILANPACALDPNKAMSQYIHDRWGTDKGFPGGAIYAISQSADGFLWIGTERGLVRFDGFDFTLVRQPIPGSPPIGPVRGLVSDAAGNLWIRPDGPQLLLYRDGHFEDAFARFNLDESIITVMSADVEGGLLLSGIGSRALRYRKGKFESIANAQEAPGTVLSMAETRDGKIWMGTRDDGLFRVNQGHISKMSTELADAKINMLLASDGGGLWIGTDNGLVFLDVSGSVKPVLPSSLKQVQILSMIRDRETSLWIGTDRGLIRITAPGEISLGLVDQAMGNGVTAICEDSDRDIWFGGPRGLERLRDGIFTTYSNTEGLPSENNGPIYVDPERRAWFAPRTGGLYWLKGGRVGRVSVAGLDQDIVYSISGGKGEVWIGRQRGGLTLLTSAGDSFVARSYTQTDGLAQNSVYSVHRNQDGTVWAGTVSGGLSRLKDGVFTNYSAGEGPISNTVNSIVEGFDGKMWFATPSGLECFANGHWTNLSAQSGLPSSDVGTIFEDSKHALWIATASGLAILSNGKIDVQNLPDSLREQILGLAEDGEGYLWFATSDHVLRINRDSFLAGSLDAIDIQSYGMTDGLQDAEPVRRDRSIIADSVGRIWVSLKRGLAVADPQIFVRNALPVMVRIESVSASGSPVSLQNSPIIAAGSQNITFNYVGTSLSVPGQVRFRYKLDGSDRFWSTIVALRQVVYTRLGPGSYRFRVVASNGGELWNGPETTFSFSIKPAFWQTWWFRLLCLSACILAIMALYRLRMYQLTQRLNVLFQERLAERTRIAQDLHDTLLQGVLSASLQLDLAEDQLPDGSPTRPLIRRILQLMRQVTEEGRSALHGLRTTDEDHRNLEVAFSRMRQEFSVNEKIGYRIIVRGDTRSLHPMIRDDMYRIGREALVNAFLHANANTVEVEVEYASKYLRVLVRDDGRGIGPEVLHLGREGHWGLMGMRERSERIGANLKLRSGIGVGTEIELTVPGAIAFENQTNGSISRWLPWLRREKFKSAPSDPKEGGINERSNSDPNLQRGRSSDHAGRNRRDNSE
jgi:ligand-binding sensor domain-containing protein/signal transduction histidine kinase